MFSVVHSSVVTSSTAQKSYVKISKYQGYEHELNMPGVQYPKDIKDIGKFEHQNNISVNVYGWEEKIYFRYVLPPWPLQDITWIYYISQLVKNLIAYWWNTWADWYWDNIIMTTTKDISANIVCMAVPVKRYWKTIRKDGSYTGQKNQAPRNWRREGAWQSQVYNNRILTMFTFCHLRRFRKGNM